ncbi:MAG: 2Fe-2S iron-sulfur cluster binding domain-containing protein [Oricola sp.]|nr:2Fe-2S iron-sulfur cluster-binding protein [Marinicaulis flavus]MCK5750487.1 2Fe-2S iron-sulfur cluster binding domain-containing protein [Oricola sp.]
MGAFRISIPEAGCISTCEPDETVLAAMGRHGLKKIPSGCHGGGCGVCKIRILSGCYRVGKMNRDVISPKEIEDGFALACKTIAEGDLEIAVVGRMRKFYRERL